MRAISHTQRSAFVRLVCLLVSSLPAFCQPQNIITLYAGTTWRFPQDPIPALQAPLGVVQGVAEDTAGNIYLTDGNNTRIFKIDKQGSLSVFAGNGVFGFAGDGGAAVDASLLNPLDVVVDARGIVYFSDAGNCRVRRVDPTGAIDTVAGSGDCGFSGDGGPAAAASLGTALRIALDGVSNLYISDPDNARVRKVTPAGIISTIAGTGRPGFSGDGGPAINARLRLPAGLAVDSDGSLYIADMANARVRRIRPDGIIVTFAGSGGGPNFSGDGGPATAAQLNQPKSVTADHGTLLIADFGNNRIRRVTPDGTINTIAGNGQPGMSGDGGPAAKASLNGPSDIAVTSRGLLIADHNNFRVRLMNAAGVLSTLAGNGNYHFDGDGGLSTSASLAVPTGLAIDPSGNLNVCDNWANRVRTITPFGIIKTIAGTSRPGFSGDGGPAAAASLSDCRGIASDTAGNLYVVDTGNHRIRKITASGVISTFAGSGTQGFAGDKGPATAASLDSPEGVAVDATGNVYVVDTGNNRVRRVTPAGVIDTIAGSGKPGYTGDGGPAIAATFRMPSRVTVDSAGAIYVSDNGNSVVRKISAGVISTVAGNGKDGFSGDGGPATSAMLSSPVGMAVDSSGALYVADQNNHRVRKISAGVITTFAGNGFVGLGGNGRAPQFAALNQPTDVALGADGRIYISDRNGRVRCVIATPAPSLQLSQKGLTFRAAANNAGVLPRTLLLSNDNTGTLSFSALATTTSGGDWLKVLTPQGVASDTTPAAIGVSVNQAGLAPGDYFGRIQVGSPGAPNSPRLITVVMTVVPAAQESGPDVSPAGLVFTGFAGGPSPAPQTISISGSGVASQRFSTSVTVSSGKSWLSASPATGPVTLQTGARITITPDTTGMAAQVSNASLKITFADGSSRTIQLTLILAPPGIAGASIKAGRSASDACAPTALSIVPTSLPTGFAAPVSYPVPVEAKVVDSCAQPLVGGSVVATFSNGDPPLSLFSLQNGTWSATWQPRSSAAVTITLSAQTRAQGIKGTATISGQLLTNVQLPVVNTGGVVNAASLSKDNPVAPGTLVAILGSALSDAAPASAGLPYPTLLGGTQVLLGGVAVPLHLTSDGLVNGVVPFDLAIGTQEIVIQHQGVVSVPEAVEVDSSGAGVFTVDGSGKGMAVAFDNSSGLTVGSAAAVGAGEVLTIFCTGLGAVEAIRIPGGDPTVQLDAGEAAPLSPAFAASGDVEVNIGGIEADVSFAGIAPKSAGLYQVTVTVPPGVSSGSTVPLVVSVDGVQGPPVSIPIR